MRHLEIYENFDPSSDKIDESLLKTIKKTFNMDKNYDSSHYGQIALNNDIGDALSKLGKKYNLTFSPNYGPGLYNTTGKGYCYIIEKIDSANQKITLEVHSGLLNPARGKDDLKKVGTLNDIDSDDVVSVVTKDILSRMGLKK